MPYLKLWGTVAGGWQMARAALIAHREIGKGSAETEFYKAKLYTARFYFDHLLPRAEGHATSITKPSKSLMKMPVESFVFE